MRGMWLRSVCLVLALAGPFSAVGADSEAPRIAVIAAPGVDDLAAVVAARLSAVPTLSLVERGALEKIGDERTLREMAAKDGLSLGRLLHADGLLVVSQSGDTLSARLTDCRLGLVLFDDAYPAQPDLAGIGDAIGSHVERLGPKLLLPPERAIPISVLNLRADFSTPAGERAERALSLLLENRLSSIPLVVVSERRHAGAVALERTLAEEPLPEAARGRFWIDGSLHLPLDQPGVVTVSLRMRRLASPETVSFEEAGTLGGLSSLASALAGRIATALKTPAPSDVPSGGEAREFLKEAIWAWHAYRYDAAREALESAALLGEDGGDFLVVRIRVLCDGLDKEIDALRGQPAPPATMGEWTDEMRQALDDAGRYRRDNLQAGLTLFSPTRDPVVRADDLRRKALSTASRLLVLEERQADSHAGALRTALRGAAPFDPARQQFPQDIDIALNFADCWALSADEEESYYRVLCSSSDAKTVAVVARTLAAGGPDRFCPRFLTDSAPRRGRYLAFAQSWEKSPATRPLGLLLQAADPGAANPGAAFSSCLRALSEEKEALLENGFLGAYGFALQVIPESVRAGSAGQGLALLDGFLARARTNNERDQALLDVLWRPEAFPPDNAAHFWTALQDYKRRCTVGQDHYAYDYADAVFSPEEKRYLARFPKPSEAGPSGTAPLDVTRFWHPAASSVSFFLDRLTPVPGGVAFLGFFNGDASGVYRVNLADFQTSTLDFPEGKHLHDLQVDGATYYVSAFRSPIRSGEKEAFWLARHDAASAGWEIREVPSLFRLFFTGGALYCARTQWESGIGLYDWASGQMQILADNRRKPALHQFDDCKPYDVRNVFRGPGGNLCANIDAAVYRIEPAGPWTRLPIGASVYAYSGSAGTVAVGFHGRVTFLDPRASEPTLWVDATGSAPWDRPPGVQWGQESAYGTHDGDFFVLAKGISVPRLYELLWFRHGERKPLAVPLHFQLDAASRAALQGAYRPEATPGMEFFETPERSPFLLRLCATDSGLCLSGPQGGFWFLPYPALEAYAKAAPTP